MRVLATGCRRAARRHGDAARACSRAARLRRIVRATRSTVRGFVAGAPIGSPIPATPARSCAAPPRPGVDAISLGPDRSTPTIRRSCGPRPAPCSQSRSWKAVRPWRSWSASVPAACAGSARSHAVEPRSTSSISPGPTALVVGHEVDGLGALPLDELVTIPMAAGSRVAQRRDGRHRAVLRSAAATAGRGQIAPRAPRRLADTRGRDRRRTDVRRASAAAADPRRAEPRSSAATSASAPTVVDVREAIKTAPRPRTARRIGRALADAQAVDANTRRRAAGRARRRRAPARRRGPAARPHPRRARLPPRPSPPRHAGLARARRHLRRSRLPRLRRSRGRGRLAQLRGAQLPRRPSRRVRCRTRST